MAGRLALASTYLKPFLNEILEKNKSFGWTVPDLLTLGDFLTIGDFLAVFDFLLLGAENDFSRNKLVFAAGRGDYVVVDRLMKDGTDINARCIPPLGMFNNGNEEVRFESDWLAVSPRGLPRNYPVVGPLFARTALQAAADGGHEDVVRLLVKNGAEVNAPPAVMFGRTALQAAAEGGYEDVVKLLIGAGADINTPPAKGSGRTALQAAAEGGHMEVVALLLKARARVNAPPAEGYGRTALQAASEGGHKDVVKLLIESGAEVNAPPAKKFGRTALQAAAEGGHKGVVAQLLEFGADVNAFPAEISGRTALQAAAESGHKEVVKLLLKAKDDINAPPAGAQGRLEWEATKAGVHEEVLRVLVSPGAPNPDGGMESTNDDQLVLAAGGGYLSVVGRLVLDGADLSARCPPPLGEFNNGQTRVTAIIPDPDELHVSSNGWSMEAKSRDFARTALQVAAEGGYEEVVKFLINAGADVNAPPAKESGRTAFQAAAEGGHKDVMKFLVKAGADINAPPAQRNGRTALQAAAGGGHEEVVKLLIDAGANINAPPAPACGRTALQAAAEGLHKKVLELLMNAGALIEEGSEPTNDNKLVLAAGAGDQAEVKRLLDLGAGVSSRFLPPFGESDGKPGVVNFRDYRLQLAASPDGGPIRQPVIYFARTALQAAAGGGHEEVVRLLVEAAADVNAPPAERRGRAALQAAAEGGHEEVIKLLIKAKADVNALPAKLSGRTALQAAAEGGHKKVVALLLRAKARVNALPAKDSGRTALQAAAGGGHIEVVKLLINAGASVNAPPAKRNGRTALQAAAEGGHEEVVKVLIKATADVNAPPAEEFGRTALQAAAEGWHEEVLKLLVEAGVNLHMKNQLGETILHQACRAGDVHQLSLILKLARFEINAVDHLGSTPLHLAVRGKRESLLRTLLREEGIDVHIKDYSGKTPLEIALDKEYGKIVDLLLEKGARVNGMSLDKLPFLLRARRVADNQDTIILCASDRTKKAYHSFEVSNRRRTQIYDLFGWPWTTPSLCFFIPPTGTEQPDHKESLVDPRAYLKDYYDLKKNLATEIEKPDHKKSAVDHRKAYDDPGDQRETLVEWTWLTIVAGEAGGGIKCQTTIPSRKQVLNSKSARADVILVGYVCFNTLIHDPDAQAAGDKEIKSFRFKNRRTEISWVMREPTGSSQGCLLRSVSYRGALNLEYLSIPNSGVEFFTSFLDAVNRNWSELFEEAKLHLAKIRAAQLEARGEGSTITSLLLENGQHWNKLRIRLMQHVLESKRLLKDFKQHEVLYLELPDCKSAQGAKDAETAESDEGSEEGEDAENSEEPEGGEENGNGEGGSNSREDTEELAAIRELSGKIADIEKRCMDTISTLEKETTDMIQLEFSLVSIHESRKSIEMSISMKRLSWITFIFLPLSFVTGLFGMNVNLLQNNPNWLFYLAFALPTLTLVLLVWLLCKYFPVEEWVRENIGSRLQRRHGKARTEKASTGSNSTEPGFEGLPKPKASGPVPIELEPPGGAAARQESLAAALTNLLRRRQKSRRSDEENTAVLPTPAISSKF